MLFAGELHPTMNVLIWPRGHMVGTGGVTDG
jgi:hypothetical protein